MQKRLVIACAVLAMIVVGASVGLALIHTDGEGRWPKSWPKELEQFRKQARTIDVMHGIQERVYEIPFDSQEDFEKAWPHVLTLKSIGAPLIIEKSPSYYGVSGSTAEAGVRILCPSGGRCRIPGGKWLTAGPPWPKHIVSESGELPEYVVNENSKWVAAEHTKGGGGHRARVDIVLIADGKIVDLNRIPLPPDTPIIDNRFKDTKQRAKPDSGDGK